MWFLWKAYLAAAWKPNSIWSWRNIHALPGFGNSGARLAAEACAASKASANITARSFEPVRCLILALLRTKIG
jgi:hypothetical protein